MGLGTEDLERAAWRLAQTEDGRTVLAALAQRCGFDHTTTLISPAGGEAIDIHATIHREGQRSVVALLRRWIDRGAEGGKPQQTEAEQ